MKRWLILLAVSLGLAFAQRLEVGGEASLFGIRPYAVLSWPTELGRGLWVIPSAFVYLDSLEATLRRGWVSVQLLQEGDAFTVGLEGFWSLGHGPALRLFLRVF